MTTIKDIVSFLLQSITQTALPSIMVRKKLMGSFCPMRRSMKLIIQYIFQGNICHLTDGALLSYLLQSLNNLHHLSLIGMTSFYSHLSEIGFLGDVFTIQSKFRYTFQITFLYATSI